MPSGKDSESPTRAPSGDYSLERGRISCRLKTSERLFEAPRPGGCVASPNKPAVASQTRDSTRRIRDVAAPNTYGRPDLRVHQNRGSPCDAYRRGGDDRHGVRRGPDRDPAPAGM